MQHKWHKEIKAWADGAEIEQRYSVNGKWFDWFLQDQPEWQPQDWYEFRIKPQSSGCLACVTCGQLIEQSQPKEPQYLYVFFNKITAETQLEWYKPEGILDDGMYEYKGKIKLEVEND